jgi:hypothetical protein
MPKWPAREVVHGIHDDAPLTTIRTVICFISRLRYKFNGGLSLTRGDQV